ncbi:13486_t:CDS:2, partial [Dentiscutata heterogama]
GDQEIGECTKYDNCRHHIKDNPTIRDVIPDIEELLRVVEVLTTNYDHQIIPADVVVSMFKIKNFLFDSIFLEMHSELKTLNDELNELYEVYQPNNLKDDSDSDGDSGNDNNYGIGNRSKNISSESQEDDVNDNIISEEGHENN